MLTPCVTSLSKRVYQFPCNCEFVTKAASTQSFAVRGRLHLGSMKWLLGFVGGMVAYSFLVGSGNEQQSFHPINTFSLWFGYLKQGNLQNPNPVECKARKLLPDNMLYLLVMCPFMLPAGTGQI
uniref:Uncharacterized protein n=1 Tax=Vitis vinifera TaxID=29760 RepID=F6HYW2_VITVI